MWDVYDHHLYFIAKKLSFYTVMKLNQDYIISTCQKLWFQSKYTNHKILDVSIILENKEVIFEK